MSDPFQSHRPGIGNVGSYQASGHPFVTGSSPTVGTQHAIFFPYVTKNVFIASRASGVLYVHFAPQANNNVINGNHFYTLPSSGTLDLSVKCKEIYISAPGTSVGGKYELIAELTTISTVEMFPLTGSGLTL